MKVHELVGIFASAVESPDPMASTRTVLEGLSKDVESIERALDYISGTGGNARQVFYRSRELTLLKVCFPPGRRTPPHDHGTWAAILMLSGEEKNTLYRCEGGPLRKAGEATLTRGKVLTLRADTAHVAECLSAAPAIGLHVYGGDIFELPRRMWDPEKLDPHVLDWQVYERFAAIASRAASAPLA